MVIHKCKVHTLLSDMCRYIINFSTYANHQYSGSLVCTFRWSVCAITVCHWSKLDCLQGQRSRVLLQLVHYVSMVNSVCHSFETRLFVCIVDTVIQEVYLTLYTRVTHICVNKTIYANDE